MGLGGVEEEEEEEVQGVVGAPGGLCWGGWFLSQIFSTLLSGIFFCFLIKLSAQIWK